MSFDTQSKSSKESVIAAIKKLAQKLGRPPSRREIEQEGFSARHIMRFFRTWRDAICASGFTGEFSNDKLPDEKLLEDWGKVARKNGRIPRQVDYKHDGSFSCDALRRRFGSWSSIPHEFRKWADGKPEWADVSALLATVSDEVRNASGTVNNDAPLERKYQRHARRSDTPTYGNPLDFRGLRHEPINEQGVVFLFGMVAHDLGYMVEAVQGGFPDCEAKRAVAKDKWQRVRIEFEFESRNFLEHGHLVDGCDLIVCWRHTWPECPIEVLELRSILQKISSTI